MIRVTYPYEGLYAKGEPRYEQIDKDNKITFCRLATSEEAMTFMLVDALADHRSSMDALTAKLTDLAAYGITTTPSRSR